MQRADIIVLAVGFSAIFCLVSLLLFLEEKSCKSKWRGTFNAEYSILAECRIEVNGRWIPADNYRVFE